MSPLLLSTLRVVALVVGLVALAGLAVFAIGFGEALREWYDE